MYSRQSHQRREPKSRALFRRVQDYDPVLPVRRRARLPAEPSGSPCPYIRAASDSRYLQYSNFTHSSSYDTTQPR
jgi:hypothetical protein